ncbi:MAG: sigma-70 family RNA polymerase sigma factor [Planctomycetota bacterium]
MPRCNVGDDDLGERALVARARAGDRAALEALLATHAPRVQRFLTTMLACPVRADDACQETLHRASMHLDQLADDARFGSWLLAIAANTARNTLRADVLREHAGDEALREVADARRSALSSLVRREDAARVALAIDRLPIALREAFVLFAVEGMPYAEIAVVTGVTEGTLQVRVHRAKALLRTQLGAVVDTLRLHR